MSIVDELPVTLNFNELVLKYRFPVMDRYPFLYNKHWITKDELYDCDRGEVFICRDVLSIVPNYFWLSYGASDDEMFKSIRECIWDDKCNKDPEIKHYMENVICTFDDLTTFPNLEVYLKISDLSINELQDIFGKDWSLSVVTKEGL